ncbi:uncharacterized protein LOC115924653 [Strongylocentrotus purpuratus]|uniref:SEA domain-containing protein n=1 Tax=Strongylocentrotus purpuratus TaxID=7668 RepID=A0A7M7NXZ2_STRPU|nr:uncharacterized protein LOC115924653 [Strongylocentrotus purpuratus]
MAYEIIEIDGNEANFTDELTDPQSNLYQELEAKVCTVAVGVYGDLAGYSGCTVYNFTSGSIIAWFYTDFLASSDVTEATLLNETLIKLENGNGSLGANGTVFTIDKNTISITEINVITTKAQTSNRVDVTTATPKEPDNKWQIVAYSMIGAVAFLILVVLVMVCCGDRITRSCRTNDKLVVSVNGNPVMMSDGVVAEEGISPWQTYKSHAFTFFPGAWAISEDGRNHPPEMEMDERTTIEGQVHDVDDDFDDDYTDDEDTVFDDTRFPPPPPAMMTSSNDDFELPLYLDNVDHEFGIDNVTYNVVSN